MCPPITWAAGSIRAAGRRVHGWLLNRSARCTRTSAAVKPGPGVTAARASALRPAFVVIALVVALATLFAVLYSLALGRPTPHHIPAGLVGPSRASPHAVPDLEHALAGAVEVRRFAHPRGARRAIRRQQIYTALILTHHPPRLLVASAASASVARLLEQTAQKVTAAGGPRIQVVDLVPLPASDPNGLTVFYVTLAATIAGFLTMFQLRANASSLSMRAWLGFVLLLALGVGFALTLATGPLIGALGGSFFRKWALLSMEVGCSALFNSAMLTVAPRWAVLPTWTLFVLLGNTSSGGAVAPPLLPAFDAFIGRWLPPGAAVEALRSVVYFPRTHPIEQVLVLVAWLAAGLGATLAATRRFGRTPGGAPIGRPGGARRRPGRASSPGTRPADHRSRAGAGTRDTPDPATPRRSSGS
jgi:hypothetical protein